VAERLKAAVLKTVRPERVSWVRIPPPPPSSAEGTDAKPTCAETSDTKAFRASVSILRNPLAANASNEVDSRSRPRHWAIAFMF
jgi:hypothetical protein